MRRREASDARQLYEDLYCAYGEAERPIGAQFELWAERPSAATTAANQTRQWFVAIDYVLVHAMRGIALRDTPFCGRRGRP